MGDVPLALAIGAGMLAAVNPCGFALLPAYLSALVLDEGTPPNPRQAIGRALTLSAAMTIGFVAVFGAFGLAITPLAGSVQRHLPPVTIGFGLALAALGGWLLAGRSMPIPMLTRGPALTGNLVSLVVFGAAYAISSLGCTIGPFLAIVVGSFRAESPLAGTALFAAYAAGMGLVVSVAAVAVALARASVVGRLRRAGRLAPRIGGGLALLAGLYVAYYGWYELRTYAGSDTADPIVDAAGGLQRLLANTVAAAGPLVAVVSLGLLVGAAVLLRRADRTNLDRAVNQGDD